MPKVKILIVLVFLISKVLCYSGVGQLIGRIITSDDRKPLVLAQVIVLNDDIGTVTNEEGNYKLLLPTGEYEIVYQMAGFRSDTILIIIHANEVIRKDIELDSQAYKGEAVIVTDETMKMFTTPFAFDFDIDYLQKQPGMVESDPIRLLSKLPGITYTNDYNGLLYIRGSRYDQSMICYDNVPVFNPYHLGGIFSIFNNDVIKKVEYSPGIYEANDGEHLGGKVNVVPQIFNENQSYHSGIASGLLSSRFIFTHKIGNHSFSISGRRMYYDLINRLTNFFEEDSYIANDSINVLTLPKSDRETMYYFYDIQGGYSWSISPRDYITINVLKTRDVMENVLEADEIGQEGLEEPWWGNTIFNFKYCHKFDKKKMIKSHLYYSKSSAYSNTLHIDIDNRLSNIGSLLTFSNQFKNHFYQIGIKYWLSTYKNSWKIDEDTVLENFVGANPTNIFFDFAPKYYYYKNEGKQSAFFLQDSYNYNALTTINMGIRLYWNSITERFQLSPRFQILRIVNGKFKLILTASQNFQDHYSLRTVSTQHETILTPFMAYFPVGKGEKSLRSYMASFGSIFNPSVNSTLKIEGYYKKMYDIPAIDQKYPYKKSSQKHNSYGLDSYLSYVLNNKFTFDIAYSLAFAIVKTNLRTFSTNYDRRHSFKITSCFKIGKGWEIFLDGFFLSGLPYTPVLGKYIGSLSDKDDKDVDWYISSDCDIRLWDEIVGTENSVRSSAYNRCDIGINKIWNYKDSRLILKMQLFNIFNSKNPWGNTTDSLNSNAPVEQIFSNAPVFPSLELKYEF